MLILSRHTNFPPISKIFTESDKKVLSLSLCHDYKNWASYVESYIEQINDVDRVLIEVIYEAPFKSILKKIEYFINSNNLDFKKFLLIESGIDKHTELESVFYPTFFKESKDVKYIPLTQRTHHYVSLARIPRPARILLTQEYFKRKIVDKGIISCHTQLDNEMFEEFIDRDFKKYFPILIKNEDSLTREIASNSNNPYFFNAIFNVVLESSFEKLPLEINPTHWDRLFITEKTIKAFNYFQIPIFLATMHHVKCLRGLGFDMFDDIINHSYDNDPNALNRIQKVADEIERISNIDFKLLQQLDIQKRLEHNANQISVVFKQKEKEYLDKVQNFLS